MNRLLIAFFVIATFASSATAQVKMNGTFKASQACPAVVSIKKGTNPDNASVDAGQTYNLLGKNKDDATHYWIEVPQADPHQRWVEISCGSVSSTQATAAKPEESNVAVNTAQGTVKPKPQSRGFGGKAPYYAFALSWEPTFCEAMRDKTECKAETQHSWEASHFALHGLWPQPFRNQFCDVDPKLSALDDQHQWNALPEPQLSSTTKAALDKAMPGTQSNLQRHEWLRHGTCYPGAQGADGYFRDEIRLADEVNASAVQKLFAANIGKQVSATQIRAAFDQAFSQGAGDHVQVECDKQGRLQGFTMNLRGDLPSGADLKTLLLAGDEAHNKCDGGVVDAVR